MKVGCWCSALAYRGRIACVYRSQQLQGLLLEVPSFGTRSFSNDQPEPQFRRGLDALLPAPKSCPTGGRRVSRTSGCLLRDQSTHSGRTQIRRTHDSLQPTAIPRLPTGVRDQSPDYSTAAVDRRTGILEIQLASRQGSLRTLAPFGAHLNRARLILWLSLSGCSALRSPGSGVDSGGGVENVRRPGPLIFWAPAS